MKDLSGRVAVVTGAASGIGLAISKRLSRGGARLVLADIEERALDRALRLIDAPDADLLPVKTDVGDPAAMDALAERVRTSFGPVDLLCLNAGVSGGGGPLETLSTEDWAWGLHVNLWGVIHGLRVFLADMKRRDEGHVVITSSIAGILCSPNAAPYHATKHAVAAIAETLFRELHAAGSGVGVSCLCPGLVDTAFPRSDRNRPAAFQSPAPTAVTPEQQAALTRAVTEIFARGVSPEHVADCVYEAITGNRFWVYTDDVHREAIQARHRALERGESPPTHFGALDGY